MAEAREGYKLVNGKLVKNIQRNITVKVKKSWTHLSEETVVGKEVKLSKTEYDFCLERGLVEEAANQPRRIEG